MTSVNARSPCRQHQQSVNSERDPATVRRSPAASAANKWFIDG